MKKTMNKKTMNKTIWTWIFKHFTCVNIIVGLFVLIFVGLIKYSGIVLFLLHFIEFDNTECAEYFITGIIGLVTRLGIKGIVEESGCSNLMTRAGSSNLMTMGGSSNLMTMGGADGTISSAGGASSGTISTTGGSSDITNTADGTFPIRKNNFKKKFVLNPLFREENIKI